MNDWISVKNRLPPVGSQGFCRDNVLAYDPEYGVCTASFSSVHGISTLWMAADDYHDPTALYNVTHWMPIPDPPEEIK